MTSLLAVLPVIWEETAAPCIESIVAADSSLGFSPDEILVVDNSREWFAKDWTRRYGVQVYRDPDGHNLGVARSWNVAAQRVLDGELDWFVIVSASMLFFPELHTTFRREIEANLSWNDEPSLIVECMGHSWHLIAIARSTLEQVGLFDPNYYPAYWEATDWACRMRLLGLEQRSWPRVWCNAASIGHAVHVDQARWGAPSCPAAPLTAYYAAKWGAMSPLERYVTPWNIAGAPLDEWPDFSIPDLARLYALDCWW